MEQKLPLTFQEVSERIQCLAKELQIALDMRNDTVKGAYLQSEDRSQCTLPHPPNPISALIMHVAIIRLERQIIDVIRQYGVECSHCTKTFVLSSWALTGNDSYLVCPSCLCVVSIIEHKNFAQIGTLLRWAPVPVLQDLFVKKMS